MDSDQKSDFDKGYAAGMSRACLWIDEYMQARKDRLPPGKNQRKRDELEHIRKTLISYIDQNWLPSHSSKN